MLSGACNRTLVEMDSDEGEQSAAGPLDDEQRSAERAIHEPAEDIARRYQREVFERAKEENTICYLETGCGKTLIAILLLKAFAPLVCLEQQSVSVFLVPTTNLVQQQADAIELHSELKVGRYTGEHRKDRWCHSKWEEEISKFEVLVMTPQILLDNLHHSLMKMKTIKLLIFDECHHCQKGHPYARIMKEFYHHAPLLERPRIFGMTASPIIGKCRSLAAEISYDITFLEDVLDAKIYLVKNKVDMEAFLPSPNLVVEEYDQVDYADATLKSCQDFLNDLKTKWLSLFKESHRKRHAGIAKIYRDLEYCLYDLGLWCAISAAEHFLTGDGDHVLQNSELNAEPISNAEKNRNKDSFIREALSFLKSVEPERAIVCDLGISERFLVTKKVETLVNLLSIYRNLNIKCIVFVERVVAAKVLSFLLARRFPHLKCKYITGSHIGLKDISKRVVQQTLKEFRDGKVNLLVATNVAEEGLDIQSCSLVVRFDLPKTVRSFVQSRGRARQRGSDYVVLRERQNSGQCNLLEQLIVKEVFIQQQVVQHMDIPLASNPSGHFDFEKFEVESTGATATTTNSVALLHHFCSKLPRDEFYQPTPIFSFLPVEEGIQCTIKLPSNAPVRSVVGRACSSMSMARRVACLEACKRLHFIGAITDYLLPSIEDESEEENFEVSQNNRKPASKAAMELQGTTIPNLLLCQESKDFDNVSLHAYQLIFHPTPRDRVYVNFALFLRSPLPKDTSNLSVELQLAPGRIVRCELVAADVVCLHQAQVIEAENFQRLLFGIMLDREMVYAGIAALKDVAGCWGKRFSKDGRWYLLLPLVHVESKEPSNMLQVDWQTIQKIMSKVDFDSVSSSTGFSEDEKSDEKILDKSYANSSVLCVANGLIAGEALRGALVRAIHSNSWYCIIGVLDKMNANSKFPDHKYSSYKEYFKTNHGWNLTHTEQPLLKAKPLKKVHNLLPKRSSPIKESKPRKEVSEELPPELCNIEILGFSDGLVNAAALIPSFMQKLENVLVAIQLRDTFKTKFVQGSHVSVEKILEAITTEGCQERFSLERLEHLGDSFLKFSVSYHLFLVYENLDEGYLTSKRKSMISNASLYKRGVQHDLTGYIRDGLFNPEEWVAPGHPCKVYCNKNSIVTIHGSDDGNGETSRKSVICDKGHRWMQRKTVADVVEALIGAYLVDGGPPVALAFMRCIGIDLSYEPDLMARACASSEDNLSLIQRLDIEEVEKLLGYKFKHKGLLLEAFTHASFNEHFGRCYQRLEFLGDSVIDYLITRHLYEKFIGLKPGQLTDLRAATVNNEKLARIALKYNFFSYLIQNSSALCEHVKEFECSIQNNLETGSEESDEWEGTKCPKVLGDIVESLAGAVLVDNEFDVDKVWEVFYPLLQPIADMGSLRLQPVRELQELCQQHQFHLQYESRNQEHVYVSEAKVDLRDETVVGTAQSRDIKSADRLAARDALKKLKSLGFEHTRHSLIRSIKSLNNNKVSFADKIREGQMDLPAITTEDGLQNNVKEVCDVAFMELGEFNPGRFRQQADGDKCSTENPSNLTLKKVNHSREDERELCPLNVDFTHSTLREEPPCKEEVSSSPAVEIEGRVSNSLSGISMLDTCISRSPTERAGQQREIWRKTEGKAELHNLSNPMSLKSSRTPIPTEFASLLSGPQVAYTENGGNEMCVDLQKRFPNQNLLNYSSVDPSQYMDPDLMGTRGSTENAKIWSRQNSYCLHPPGHIMYKGKQMDNQGEHSVDALETLEPSRQSIILAQQMAVLAFTDESGAACTAGCKVNDAVTRHWQTLQYENFEPILGEETNDHSMPFNDMPDSFSSSSFQQGSPAGQSYETDSKFSKGEARAKLYEVCADRKWEGPKFTCCKEEGMSHCKVFTFCATVTMPGIGRVECEGEPMKSKKLAMDSAANYLLKWLEEQYYL